MNNKDFISALVAQSGLPAKTVQQLVAGMAGSLVELLNDECALPVQGFGTFEVKKKLERLVVNPATKQRMLVPPRLALSFKPSPALKDKMQ